MIKAIVLSAGKGTRMNMNISKQYIEVLGFPVLYYTLKAFEDADVDEIIITTGKDDVDFVKNDIVNKYNISKVTHVVPGGKERYDSVMEGLNYVEDDDYVLIHDGARPLIKKDTINNIIREVKEKSAVIAAVPVKDTIKIVENGVAISTPDRRKLYQIQTPQAFRGEIIKNAYKEMVKIKDTTITDDSMVVEKYSEYRVSVVESDYTNIKITTKEDIDIMKTFLKK
jgi:2-C-methyl-D-erythritol 4-phosphate cytidylyltransferase